MLKVRAMNYLTKRWHWLNVEDIGGSSPVGCVLACSNVNVVSLVQHPFVWDSILNNIWDYESISELPEDLGISFCDDEGNLTDFAGSNGNLITTEAGVWSFHIITTRQPDAEFVGQLNDGGNAQTVIAPMRITEVLGTVHRFPINTWQQWGVYTQTAPSASPYNIHAKLEIVRLG